VFHFRPLITCGGKPHYLWRFHAITKPQLPERARKRATPHTKIAAALTNVLSESLVRRRGAGRFTRRWNVP